LNSSYHNSGWGLNYYLNGDYGTPVTIYYNGNYYNGEGPVWRSEYPPHTDSGDFVDAQYEMRYGGADTPDDFNDGVTCTIAHIRRASSGTCTNIEKPHPFIITLNDGTTYTFAHNGTMDKTALRNLITDDWMNNNFQPQTYGDQGCGGDWQNEGFANVVDSELYFFWILKNIMAEETGNVLRGIHKAVSHPNFRIRDEHKNFVLSDGDEIWAYRETIEDGQYEGPSTPHKWHTVYWKYVDDPTTEKQYKAVMSQPDDPNNGWEFLNERSLVYLPRSGKPFVIANFNYLPDIEQKMLKSRWNWVGFPILPNDNETTVANAFSGLTDLNDPFSFVDEISIIHEGEFSNWRSVAWEPADYLIKSVDGYKVEIIDNDYTLFNTPFIGTKIAADTPIELTEGENWICYFLPELNHPSDAFPQYILDQMISIKAQDWFLTRRNGEFYSDEICPPHEQGTISECEQLVYGNMYIITMTEPATFSWVFPHEEPLRINTPRPIHFTYQESGSYLPVVIESIENNIIELGAFNENDICVGAEVVSGTHCNFKLYNTSLENVRFEAITETGAGRIAGDTNQDKDFKPENVRIEDAVQYISLKSFKRKPVREQKKQSNSVQAYPNPFNSNTEIKITLGKSETIALEIYSVTGRHIADIKRGSLKKGAHTFRWNGKNKYQKNVPNGIYFYRLSMTKNTIKGKLLYLK
jgi:hypothetical protein